jgi:methyl-accepting chemotaxis protein
MKGTVVNTWIKTCRKVYGEGPVNDSLRSVGLDETVVFSPLVEVGDSQVFAFVKKIASLTNTDYEKVWYVIGLDNIITFSESYPAFFRHENAYKFLSSMNNVHQIVRKRFQGATPPILDMSSLGGNKASFIYRSSRGMFPYFLGLLEGVSQHFNEKIIIKEVSRTKTELELELTFEYETLMAKEFSINKLLSFGFIKSISAKIALGTAILLAIVTIPLSLLSEIIPISVALGGILITFCLTYISSKIMMRPLEYIQKEINNLQQHSFNKQTKIVSKDQYDSIFENLDNFKNILSKDFVGFNNMGDEMNTFSAELNQIAGKMSNTSDDIANIVEQVAQVAQHQAEETENSIYLLNSNIKGINEIAKEETSNKIELESSVNKIESSFVHVKNTATEINEVLIQFKSVKENGLNLKESAYKLTNIVSLVSAVSTQTNLLALNASIEAARAGEAGKGFAVVAEEVRKLSEETQDAVEKINEGLSHFTKEITSLVGNIDDQYKVLENENSQLSEAVNQSNDSKITIQEVAKKMMKTSEKLERETKSISKVFENMEALAAIAEENSASAEEVSSNVTTYTEQIKTLTKSIQDFKELTEEFSQELKVYQI